MIYSRSNKRCSLTAGNFKTDFPNNFVVLDNKLSKNQSEIPLQPDKDKQNYNTSMEFVESLHISMMVAAWQQKAFWSCFLSYGLIITSASSRKRNEKHNICSLVTNLFCCFCPKDGKQIKSCNWGREICTDSLYVDK